MAPMIQRAQTRYLSTSWKTRLYTTMRTMVSGLLRAKAQAAQGQEEGGRDSTNEVQGIAGQTSYRADDQRRERRALIALPRDEVERDRERREDDAGRKERALEFNSRDAIMNFCKRMEVSLEVSS